MLRPLCSPRRGSRRRAWHNSGVHSRPHTLSPCCRLHCPSSFSAQVLENPWLDEDLPPNTAIPEKPLVQEKKKCVIQ